MADKPRIIFLGTTNELSRCTFTALVDNGVVVDAVVVTATAAGTTGRTSLEELLPATTVSELPIVNRFHQPSLIEQAWTSGVPVFAMGKGGYQALRNLMYEIHMDAACVACFPRRIPPALTSLPRHGFLNVHPSLLPHYRGPAPMFWLFQQNDLEHRGVTIHQMDKDLDTGPIVKQEALTLADGQCQVEIESQCGRLGGRLLLDSISLLSKGIVAEAQAQTGTYYPWPKASDFRIDTAWSAQRAFNFMRATDGFSTPYQVSLPGRVMYLTEALKVDPEGEINSPASIDGPFVQLRFNPGVLTARFRAF